MSTLTLEKLRATQRLMRDMAMPELPSPAAMRITVSDLALRDTEERLFPASKNRSRRIHKKLVKRFGGEFRRVPCIYKTPWGLIAHPALYAEIKRAVEAQSNV